MTQPTISPVHANDHVFLIGRPPLSEFLGFVRTMAVDGQSTDPGQLASAWRTANDHVKHLETTEAGLADNVTVGKTDPALAADIAAVMQHPFIRRAFNLVPATIGTVELDRLVVFQKFIDLSFVEQLKARIGPNPSPQALLHFCLPMNPTLAPANMKQTANNSFTFISPSNDFRFLEAVLLPPDGLPGFAPPGPVVAALALIVGYGSNVLNVAHIENRLVLGNGSHRAFALRELGITHVPCIVQTVSRREEIEVLGYGDLQSNADMYLKSPRPPVLKDYFDPLLRMIVPVTRKQRVVQVSFGVQQSDIPAI